MLKRIAFKGMIEVPDNYEFPEKTARMKLNNVIVEVRGIHDDVQKRRGETEEIVVTCKAELSSKATVGQVLPPAGRDPNQAAVDDE